MNILLVGSFSYAGMGPYVAKIFNDFDDDHVFGFFVDDHKHYYERNIRPERKRQAFFFHRESTKLTKLRALIGTPHNVAKAFRKCCEDNNIEVIHMLSTGTLLYDVILQMMKEKKVFITVHDIDPHEADKAWHKMWKQRLLSDKLKKMNEASRNLITNSHLQLEQMRQRYPQKHLFYHAFPSLVTQEVAEGTKHVRETEGIDNYILFFGRIEKYKGVDVLYQAFAQNANLHNSHKLVIAGAGDIYFTISPEMADKVVLINRYIDDGEVADLFKRAGCVVYPYISATQSGVLSVSCFFKTPTIVSDVPFFCEQVGIEPIALTFPNKDANQLGQRIEQLLADKHTDMQAAQERYFQNEYRYGQIANQLMDIYRQGE